MDYDSLILSIDHRVATIKLDRPQALNALTMQSLTELQRALKQIVAMPDLRCLVLTGAGRGFCTGVDLTAARPGLNPDDTEEFLRDYFIPPYQLLSELRIPTIAAVNGPCAGAGMSLALSCDIVIAAASAYFLQPFVNIGLVPDLGSTWLLPHMVGKARAAGLMLLGERLSAEDAAAWGLVWKCVADGELIPEVDRLATGFSQGAPFSHGQIKQLLRQAYRNDLPAQMRLEREIQAKALQTADAREARRAFADKRKPVFTGE